MWHRVSVEYSSLCLQCYTLERLLTVYIDFLILLWGWECMIIVGGTCNGCGGKCCYIDIHMLCGRPLIDT